MGVAKSSQELQEIEFIKGGITFGNSQILYRDLNGVAGRTEIEGFIQLPSPPAGAGFPPNRIFFVLREKFLIHFWEDFPPRCPDWRSLEEIFPARDGTNFMLPLREA